MHFIIDCRDSEQGQQLRSQIRDQHLAHLNTRKTSILTAGPQLNDNGDVMGSLIIIDCDSREDVESFVSHDPYSVAGVFSDVRITAYKVTL